MRITFRPDPELAAVLEKAEGQTGLNSSVLCRLAISEYIAKQRPEKLIEANTARNVRLIRRNKKAAA